MSETPTNIVAFPFPQRDPSECDDREAVFQLKLSAAQLLNESVAGIYTLTEENIRGILRLNRLCRLVGLTPLNFDPPEP